MSFHNAETSPSDSDEASDTRQLILRRSLAPVGQREVRAQVQAHRHLHVTNYANVTVVNVNKPAQYNSGPSSGAQGYLTMCKSLILTHMRWWKKKRRCSHDSSCMHERSTAFGCELMNPSHSVQWRTRQTSTRERVRVRPNGHVSHDRRSNPRIDTRNVPLSARRLVQTRSLLQHMGTSRC